MRKRSIVSRIPGLAKAIVDALVAEEESPATPEPRPGPPTPPAPTELEVNPIAPPTIVDPLRKEALERRKDVIKLPGDQNGPRWDIAATQLELEAGFAAFCMAWWGSFPPARTYDELLRRALVATTVFHGIPIEDLPAHLREKTGE